jgi:hypothetical protein
MKVNERLNALCLAILEANDIEPWPATQTEPRALQWMLPPELIEALEVEEGVGLQLFGYPVVMEALLGDHTVALVETIALEEMPTGEVGEP